MRRAIVAALGLAALASLLSCGDDPRHVEGSGTIEMDEVDVASQVGGRVADLRVDEGDTVRVGDTLAVLDRAELTAELEAQAARAGQALAQWRDQRAGPRIPEVQVARAELAEATASAGLADAEFKRIEALFKSQVASAADLDRARTARDSAEARRRAAAEQVRLLESGYRRDQVAAARQAAEAARAQLAASRSRVGELILSAPISGVVLLRNLEPGELASAGVPVVTLGDPDRLWVRVYIAAPKIPRVRLGSPVEVRVVGSKRAFRGRVVEIATRAEFTPRAALTEEEQANLVFAVKVALDPTGGTLKPGLPAQARILAADSGQTR